MPAKQLEAHCCCLVVATLVAIFSLSASSFANPRKVTLDVRMERSILAKDCLACHDDAIDGKEYANSAHGPNACTSCHVDIIDLEKHAEGVHVPQPVDCGICHEKESAEFSSSIHRVREHFTCVDCHSEIHYQDLWQGNKVRIIKGCTACHEQENYAASGHAQAVMRGNNDSAVCSDCHGLHDTRIWHTAGRKYPVEAREFYTRVCYVCHDNKELMERSGLTTVAVETYEESPHGKIQKLGYAAAGCADCHTSHNILPEDDPNSTVNKKNVINVCSRCHTGVNANFVQFISHPDLTNRREHPQLFWTMVFMAVLLLVTLVFFWGHTLLWWRKAYWEKQRVLSEGHLISDKLAHIENPGDSYVRFKVRDRILHIVGIVTFFGLALTGLPLKYPDASWAKSIVDILAGVESTILIHRVCGLILLAAFLVVVAYGVHFIFCNKRAGSSIKERIFGPYSLIPRKKDWDDFTSMTRWFVDQGPPPRFDHWTYWEKFDYFAVFWGMFAIGLTGILMWWPHLTTTIMPGWVINISRIMHSEEALLAVGYIFTIHFFNNHFVPTKWPMNRSIFTGRVYKWEFIEDRPLEYERLSQSGELETMKTRFPSILANLFAGAVGLSAITLGLLMVVLILWAVL
jgi:cytochrome b subunit of formate dehydrogenase